MSSRHPRVARLLAALPQEPLAAVLRQLEFTPDLDGQMELIAAAWLIHAEGGPAADEISRQLRDQMMRGRRDQRAAGRAADVAALAGGDDPALVLQAQQAVTSWVQPPASLNYSAHQGLTAAMAAARCHRGLRTIQTAMRRRWLAEQAGQLLLAGVPPATAVYSARRRGGEA